MIHKWEDNHNRKSYSQRSEGFKSHTGFTPTWGSCFGKTSSLELFWLWRLAGLSFGTAREWWRLYWAHKLSHAPGSREEAVIWKESGSGPLVDLGKSPGKSGGHCDLPFGHRHWQQLFEEHFLHKDTGAGKGHFKMFPLAYQCWDSALHTSQSASVLGHPRPSS